MFSSYALSILLLFILNKFSCATPFVAFRTWIQFYSQFDWANYAISTDGPVPINSILNGSYAQQQDANDPANAGRSYSACELLAHRCRQQMMQVGRFVAATNNQTEDSITPSQATPVTRAFLVRSCNIVDPLNLSNNLGISVSRQNMPAVVSTLQYACSNLEVMVASQAPALSGPSQQQQQQQQQSHGNAKITEKEGSSSSSNIMQKWSQQATKGSSSNISSIHTNGANSNNNNNNNGSTDSDPNSSKYQFLSQFFPVSLRQYFNEDQLRADLRDHPQQVGTSSHYQVYTAASSSAALSDALNNVGTDSDSSSRSNSGSFNNNSNEIIFDIETAPLWSLVDKFESRKRTYSSISTRGSTGSFSEMMPMTASVQPTTAVARMVHDENCLASARSVASEISGGVDDETTDATTAVSIPAMDSQEPIIERLRDDIDSPSTTPSPVNESDDADAETKEEPRQEEKSRTSQQLAVGNGINKLPPSNVAKFYSSEMMMVSSPARSVDGASSIGKSKAKKSKAKAAGAGVTTTMQPSVPPAVTGTSTVPSSKISAQSLPAATTNNKDTGLVNGNRPRTASDMASNAESIARKSSDGADDDSLKAYLLRNYRQWNSLFMSNTKNVKRRRFLVIGGLVLGAVFVVVVLTFRNNRDGGAHASDRNVIKNTQYLVFDRSSGMHG
jgi:hypothetical protein